MKAFIPLKRNGRVLFVFMLAICLFIVGANALAADFYMLPPIELQETSNGVTVYHFDFRLQSGATFAVADYLNEADTILTLQNKVLVGGGEYWVQSIDNLEEGFSGLLRNNANITAVLLPDSIKYIRLPCAI